MTDLLEFLDTPATDEPITAGLLFVAGAAVGFGATVVGCRALCERVRRKDRDREWER